MQLKWTGERLVTNLDHLYGTYEHLHRYALAAELCKDKVVLDIASGEGYGANILSDNANFVYGVDISEEAIDFSKKKYGSKKLKYLIGSATKIPIDSNSIDIVVSFETLEHLTDHAGMMSEIKRVLKSDGVLIISTPAKEVYFERDPDNKFHVKELTTNEFITLINDNFKFSKFFKQQIVIGSLVTSKVDSFRDFQFYDGGFDKINKTLAKMTFFNTPFFNLAIASNKEINHLDMPNDSLYSAYNAFESEINTLRQISNKFKNRYESLLNSKRVKIINGIASLFRINRKNQ